MDKRVLGRGLGALISEPQAAEKKEYVEYLQIDEIKPNRYQPREIFDEERLRVLMASIKKKGVVQPILVRRVGGGFELIAGERRLRAAKALGYQEMPAVIKDVDDLNAMELALIENLQREDLNPIEEAHAYEKLTEVFGFSQEMIGQAVGKDRATVSNTLRLLTLSKDIQGYLSKDMISAGHAKVLLSLEDENARVEFAKRILKDGISVRMLEELIMGRKGARKKKAALSNDMRSIEEAIQERLGTKVRIRHGKKRGQINIEYYSNEDLSRILKVLGCGVM